MVIRWTDTFQRRIHVNSTSKFTLRFVRWIYTSNRRRFYVEKYLCGYGIFFNVEISLSTRTVDSPTSNIRRFHVDASPTVFVDFSTLNARRFNVDISHQEVIRWLVLAQCRGKVLTLTDEMSCWPGIYTRRAPSYSRRVKSVRRSVA